MKVLFALYTQVVCDEAQLYHVFQQGPLYAKGRIVFLVFSGFANMHKPMTVFLLADSHTKSLLQSAHLNPTYYVLLSDSSTSSYF